ncbi:hypothetical protein EON63_20435 [archaeon]|nr:MAG: hypothetical protein EON63_20435 [archaeon]
MYRVKIPMIMPKESMNEEVAKTHEEVGCCFHTPYTVHYSSRTMHHTPYTIYHTPFATKRTPYTSKLHP